MMRRRDIERIQRENPPINVEWEDVATILREEDPTFNEEDWEKKVELFGPAQVEIEEEEDTSKDLLQAIELLGRVNDFFQVIDHKTMRQLVPQSLWKFVLELDNDIIEFLNGFEKE